MTDSVPSPSPVFRKHPLRRVAFQLHLWSGLVLGLVFAVVCVSGSLITFRGEIEDALRPHLTRVDPGTSRVALQPLLDRVRAQYPGDSVNTVNLPPEPHRAASFWLTGPEGRTFHVFFNPWTGEILGEHDARNNLTEWLYLLHAQLLLGGRGEQLNGIFGILLVIMCLTGAILWWPGVKQWVRNGLTIQWRARWKRLNYDLHKVVGITTALLIAVIALTGVYFPFREPFRWLAQVITGTEVRESSPQATPSDQPRRSVDEAIASALAAMPEGELDWVGLPNRPDQIYTVRKRLPGEWRLEGMNHIHVDPYTAAVIRLDRHRERTAGQRLLRTMFPIHIGTFGGLFTRVLWTVLGFVPLLLFITGLLMWRNRVLVPRRLRAAHSLAP